MLELKSAIYNDNGAVLGVLVTDSFYDAKSDGVIGAPNGCIYGMHAIAAVGWDDTKVVTIKDKKYTGCVIIQNSWGKDWGDNGFGYIPYDIYNWRSADGWLLFVEEAWTSYDITDGNSNLDYHKGQKENVVDNDKLEIKLKLGDKKAYVNGNEKLLLEAPISINGTTMVPVRFISETFNCKVNWDKVSKEITITK